MKIIWYSKKGEVIKVMEFSELKDFDLNSEMIILDLEGRILRRIYLPLASIRPERGVLRYDLFTVCQDKLYELVQNRASKSFASTQ